MDRLQEGDTGAFITCDHLCVRVAGLQPLPPSPPSRFGALPFPQKRPRLLPPGWPPEAPPNDLPPRRVAFAAAFAAAPGTSAGVRAGFGFYTEVKAPRLSILATVTFTLQSARHVHSAVPPAPLCTSEPLLPRAGRAHEPPSPAAWDLACPGASRKRITHSRSSGVCLAHLARRSGVEARPWWNRCGNVPSPNATPRAQAAGSSPVRGRWARGLLPASADREAAACGPRGVRTWASGWLCGNCQAISHSSYAPRHGQGLRVTTCPRSGSLCVCVAATALTGTSAVICDAEHLLGVLAVCASSLEKRVKGPSPSSGRALSAAGLYSSLRPWFPDSEPLRFPGVACHSTGCLSASLATSLMHSLSLW